MTGFIAWRGPSPLNGTPMVLVVTGRSHNAKTGPMYQAWLLVADRSPAQALKTKADIAICGDCVHRAGARTCYVSMFYGPSQIWRALEDGRYQTLSLREAADELRGESLRITAYGDPAFVPFEVWDTLLTDAIGWAGYTHQWRTCDPRFRALLMASVESEAESAAAHALGWRTFRARPIGAPLVAGEFQCPATEEGGHRTTCVRCQLCRGTSSPAKSVSLHLHGKSAAPRTGQPREKYADTRAAFADGRDHRLRLTPAERSRAVLALTQFYRRRKEAVRVRSRRAGDGFYRFWLEPLREITR